MAGTVSAFDFLSGKGPTDIPAVNVVFGDDPYLKRQAVAALIARTLTGEDAQIGLSRLTATPHVEWRDVVDDLATMSLFGGGRRLVVIDDADDLVSRLRGELEDYVQKPVTAGVLLLTVTKWQKSTRLYKFVEASGLQVECKCPSEGQVVKWLQSEARLRFEMKLSSAAAEQMVEIVGCELGILDQELAKLSLVADSEEDATPERIRAMIGGWRARTVWDMLDAAYDGDTREALVQLERLIHAGEHPVAILGQIAASLRLFAAAAKIFLDAERSGRRMGLRGAIEAAGFKPFVIGKAERRLKRMGRDRAACLYRWLLDADLAMKGASSSMDRARLELERLIVRIAAPRETVPTAAPLPLSPTRLG